MRQPSDGIDSARIVGDPCAPQSLRGQWYTDENSVALKSHRDLGFETAGVIPQAGWKFGRWIDLVILQKMF